MAVAISAGVGAIIQSTLAAAYWSYTPFISLYILPILWLILFTLFLSFSSGHSLQTQQYTIYDISELCLSRWQIKSDWTTFHIQRPTFDFYPITLLDPKWYQKRLDFKPDWTNISCLEANHETMSAVLYIIKWCCLIWMKILLNLSLCGLRRWTQAHAAFGPFLFRASGISQTSWLDYPSVAVDFIVCVPLGLLGTSRVNLLGTDRL